LESIQGIRNYRIVVLIFNSLLVACQLSLNENSRPNLKKDLDKYIIQPNVPIIGWRIDESDAKHIGMWCCTPACSSLWLRGRVERK
jgi:hypothetical protein